MQALGTQMTYHHTVTESTYSQDGFTLPSKIYTFYLLGVKIFEIDYCEYQSVKMKALKDPGFWDFAFVNCDRPQMRCPAHLVPYIWSVIPSIMFQAELLDDVLCLSFQDGGRIWNHVGKWKTYSVVTDHEITVGNMTIHRDRKITGPEPFDLSHPDALPVWRKLTWALRSVAPSWVE